MVSGPSMMARCGSQSMICAPMSMSLSTKKGRLSNWASAGSLHTGGCHVLLGDGAVRFVSENIDTTTRQRLHYRADGQVLGEF